MIIASFIGILLIFITYLMFSEGSKDYTKKSDLELIQLLGLHKNNVKAAIKISHERHKVALDRMSYLTAEMKKRGLIKQETAIEDQALQGILGSVAQEKISRSVKGIQIPGVGNDSQRIIRDNETVALMLLGVIAQGALAKNSNRTSRSWILGALTGEEMSYFDKGFDALIANHLAGEENGELFWTEGGKLLAAYEVAARKSPTFEEDTKDHEVLTFILRKINEDNRFTPFEQFQRVSPSIDHGERITAASITSKTSPNVVEHSYKKDLAGKPSVPKNPSPVKWAVITFAILLFIFWLLRVK